jgi:hypothetical protein
MTICRSVIASSNHDLVKTNNNNKIGHGVSIQGTHRNSYYMLEIKQRKMKLNKLHVKFYGWSCKPPNKI